MSRSRVKVQFNANWAIKAVTRSKNAATIDLMEEVKDLAVELCPKDTGELRKSAKVNYNGSSTNVTFDKHYAAVQHERLDFRHKIGQAKYLETAFNQTLPHLKSRIAEYVRQGLQ